MRDRRKQICSYGRLRQRRRATSSRLTPKGNGTRERAIPTKSARSSEFTGAGGILSSERVAEDPLPFDPKQFSLSHARAVFDMVYLPAETPLLRAAKGAGCRTADGLGMLLYQGAKALEIWSGRTAPLEVMRLALEKRVHGN